MSTRLKKIKLGNATKGVDMGYYFHEIDGNEHPKLSLLWLLEYRCDVLKADNITLTGRDDYLLQLVRGKAKSKVWRSFAPSNVRALLTASNRHQQVLATASPTSPSRRRSNVHSRGACWLHGNPWGWCHRGCLEETMLGWMLWWNYKDRWGTSKSQLKGDLEVGFPNGWLPVLNPPHALGGWGTKGYVISSLHWDGGADECPASPIPPRAC